MSSARIRADGGARVSGAAFNCPGCGRQCKTMGAIGIFESSTQPGGIGSYVLCWPCANARGARLEKILERVETKILMAERCA